MCFNKLFWISYTTEVPLQNRKTNKKELRKSFRLKDQKNKTKKIKKPAVLQLHNSSEVDSTNDLKK